MQINILWLIPTYFVGAATVALIVVLVARFGEEPSEFESQEG